jgi:arsenate reductase
MKERGIDISSQTSKPLAQFEGKPFDIVITVCDDAYQKCPVFPGVKQQLHWNTPDPGLVIGTKEEQREAFRATIVSLEQKILELASQIHET